MQADFVIETGDLTRRGRKRLAAWYTEKLRSQGDLEPNVSVALDDFTITMQMMDSDITLDDKFIRIRHAN